MKRFGLQIYSVRDHMADEQSLKQAFLELGKMGYTYAHTAGTYDFITPEKFAQYAKDAGIEVCGTHYNWDRIVNDVEGTVAYHKILGTTNVGIGAMSMAPRENEEALAEFIKQFNETAKKYAAYGMKLTYHHHSFEFVKLSDGKTIFDRLVEGFTEPNTSFVLDTYWLQHGGKDVRAVIEQLAGRVEILHLKDMAAMKRYTVAGTDAVYFAPAITEVGSGNINFKDIIPLAEKCGVKYFVVEDDRAVEVGSYDAVKKSADYIKANLLD
ncbi:MAG: sugar phosphate isomerase/epimerase [Ruminococcaceae bacterium]|nr:sugar phosphate isomerase/epimerase [Oscillospiraceae bacterium]